MKSAASLVAAFTALAALPLALAAGDAWKKKPPAQWTQGEILEVLTDSPWAKRVSVWQVTGQTQQRIERQRTTYQDSAEEVPTSITTERSSTLPEVVEGVYRVQWSSAGVLGQAWQQLQQAGATALLEQHGPPPQRPADFIVLTVRMAKPPPEPALPVWASANDEELRGRARLTTSEKRTVAPAGVVRHGVGAGAAVSFYFPRALEGQPLLSAETKWAELVLESLLGDKLKVKFNLKDMQAGGRPDY